MKEVVVIGGGAAGLFCALNIKRLVEDSANVVILERLEKVGKKILATGNGRCNYTNKNLQIKKYNNPSFVKSIFEQFDYNKTISEFNRLGIIERIDSEGRVYPSCEMASAVLDALRLECKRLGVVEKCNFEVKKITKNIDEFVIENTRGVKINADFVVVATGGKADPVLGSNGSGYALLKHLKVHITDLYPGLVGAKFDPALVKGLEGIRSKCEVKLYNKRNKLLVWKESGEVLFKKDGISGIVAMQMMTQVARYTACKKANHFYCSLDLMPNKKESEILALLKERTSRLAEFPNESLFIGLFHKMIGMHLLKRSKIDLNGYIKDITPRDLQKLVTEIKNMIFEIKDSYSFDKAQVTIGGIETSELVVETLELHAQPKIYAVGEIIDIDGECGGYNLQWAWSSAYVVAEAISNRIKVLELCD